MTPGYEDGNVSQTPSPAIITMHVDRLELCMTILLFYLICPLVVILNLILLIKIVAGQPWTWLIANNSFCMICTAILGWNKNLPPLYFVRSLMSMPACYFFQFFNTATWAMTAITSTVIVTERFHCLRIQGNSSKKQVLLLFIPFWIIVTLCVTLPSMIGAISHRRWPIRLYSLTAYRDLCSISTVAFQFTMIFLWMFIWIWSFSTFIVVFVGLLVMKGRDTITDSMKRSIVHPTLALVCVSFIFLVLPVTVFEVDFILGSSLGFRVHECLNFLLYINNISFPIIWLITLSRCGQSENGDNPEEAHRMMLNVRYCQSTDSTTL